MRAENSNKPLKKINMVQKYNKITRRQISSEVYFILPV